MRNAVDLFNSIIPILKKQRDGVAQRTIIADIKALAELVDGTDDAMVTEQYAKVLKSRNADDRHSLLAFMSTLVEDVIKESDNARIIKGLGRHVPVAELLDNSLEEMQEQPAQIEDAQECTEEEELVKAVGYVRISDGARQDSKTQESAIKEYVKANGLELSHIVVEAKSGSKTKLEDREFSKLRNELADGSHLVITEVSRLGRNRPMQIMGLLDELAHDRGVTIHLAYSDAAIDKQSIDDPAMFFQIVGAGFVAQQEAKRRSERATAAHARRKSQGLAVGRAKGAIVSNWLDDHEWLINSSMAALDNNVTQVSYDLSNSLRRNNKEVNQKTLRSQLSRWLKRREELKKQCIRNKITPSLSCTEIIELLQAKQKNGSLVE